MPDQESVLTHSGELTKCEGWRTRETERERNDINTLSARLKRLCWTGPRQGGDCLCARHEQMRE